MLDSLLGYDDDSRANRARIYRERSNVRAVTDTLASRLMINVNDLPCRAPPRGDPGGTSGPEPPGSCLREGCNFGVLSGSATEDADRLVAVLYAENE